MDLNDGGPRNVGTRNGWINLQIPAKGEKNNWGGFGNSAQIRKDRPAMTGREKEVYSVTVRPLRRRRGRNKSEGRDFHYKLYRRLGCVTETRELEKEWIGNVTLPGR